MIKKLLLLFFVFKLSANEIAVDLNNNNQLDSCKTVKGEYYPKIKCFLKSENKNTIIFDNDYPNLTEFHELEVIKSGFKLSLNGRNAAGFADVTYINNLWKVTRMEITYYFAKFDPDRPTMVCKANENFNYSELLIFMAEEPENFPEPKIPNLTCPIKYNIDRSFNEIYTFFTPDPEDKDDKYEYFDYVRAATSNNYIEFSNPDRYVAYLKKYPMTPERVERYYQMGNILNQVKLYNESNLLLANVIANYPNFVTSYLIMGDNYWGLEETQQAKENYQRYLDNQTDKSKIPKRVKLRLQIK